MPADAIALDVMGGDAAPEATLRGALDAVDPSGPLAVPPGRILLVGESDAIESGLRAAGGNPGFRIQHASQVVGMGDPAAAALRAKPDSSIARAVQAVREGHAGGLVSMGNTGACVGAATLGLGTLEGVRRPGIAVTLALTDSPLTLLDMGANIAPKPAHLAQYGEMGAIYMRDCMGVEDPRVGLLNVGEEKGKGTELLKEAYPLFEGSRFRFAGNVEGSDIFRGVCDVVVTDGFTGNVVLKLLEHFSSFLLTMVMEELRSHDAAWGVEAVDRIRGSIDYSAFGGALLLGVRGVVVIGHGRSDRAAVKNALGQAARALDADVNRHIEQGLRSAG